MRFVEVRYEDLISRSAQTLERILHPVGEQVEPACLDALEHRVLTSEPETATAPRTISISDLQADFPDLRGLCAGLGYTDVVTVEWADQVGAERYDNIPDLRLPPQVSASTP